MTVYFALEEALAFSPHSSKGQSEVGHVLESSKGVTLFVLPANFASRVMERGGLPAASGSWTALRKRGALMKALHHPNDLT